MSVWETDLSTFAVSQEKAHGIMSFLGEICYDPKCFFCKVQVIKWRSCQGKFMTFGTRESKVTIPSSPFYKSRFLPQVTARLCVLFSCSLCSLQPWVWCMCVCAIPSSVHVHETLWVGLADPNISLLSY